MIPVNEQETVIQYNRDSKECNIWTSDSTMITRLDKLCAKAPEYYRLVSDTKTQDKEPAGKQYILSDKSMITLRGSRTKRVMTDEQKAEAAKRLREGRNKRCL